MSKNRFPFYFWEFFSHFYKNKDKPIATIYVVCAELIIRLTRPYMVTNYETLIQQFLRNVTFIAIYTDKKKTNGCFTDANW